MKRSVLRSHHATVYVLERDATARSSVNAIAVG